MTPTGRGRADDPGFEPGPDDVVTQLYTSGTTGLPKGAMISGRNLSAILGEADRVFHIGPDTVSLVAMPLFHIGGPAGRWPACPAAATRSSSATSTPSRSCA